MNFIKCILLVHGFDSLRVDFTKIYSNSAVKLFLIRQKWCVTSLQIPKGSGAHHPPPRLSVQAANG